MRSIFIALVVAVMALFGVAQAADAPTGTIISSQFYCDAPCSVSITQQISSPLQIRSNNIEFYSKTWASTSVPPLQ